jgi:hypothetical protein
MQSPQSFTKTSEFRADLMALRNLAGLSVSSIATFTQRIVLIGLIGSGLLITGCGDSSETQQTSSEASSDSGSTDTEMSDEAMMGDPGMDGSSMDSTSIDDDSMMMASMDPSQTGETIEELDDPSMDPGEGGGGAFSDSELSGPEGEATLAAGDPGTDISLSESDPVMTAGAEAGDTTDLPRLNADMEALEANVGEPGSEGFGPGEGEPGLDGGGDGRGGGQAKEPPADSPDYPAFKIVMGLMEGKHDGLKDHVSTRGRGLIEKIRTGSLTKAEKDNLKTTFAQPQLVGTPRTIRGSRSLTLNSGGQVITMVSKKQGSAWKVSTISIRAAKKR